MLEDYTFIADETYSDFIIMLDEYELVNLVQEILPEIIIEKL